jgi:DNA repair protein RecO (recombination protein O)
MPLYTADALVLRTYKLGEADRIVVFLTEDRGKKRGVAKGARRPRSRFAGALEPLTQVRIAYFEKERRELVGLNYAEPARSPLAARPEALGHIGYFAELLDQWAQDGDPSERLYRLGASVLDALGAGGNVEPLARYFEFWILRLQGVYPSFTACHGCGGALDVDAGGAWLAPGSHVFTCAACAPAGNGRLAPSLSREALGFLGTVRRLPPRAVGEVTMAPLVAEELERVHHVLMGRHLERELKSTRVLRELRRSTSVRPERQAESKR